MRVVDDKEAQRLVDAYSDMVLRLSFTYLKSTQDAEDICQTVFLKLLTSGKSFENPDLVVKKVDCFPVFCGQGHYSVHGIGNRRLRRGGRFRCFQGCRLSPEGPKLVLAGVDCRPDHPGFFMLRSVREIGKLLHRSEAAVSAYLSRGRKQLKLILGDEAYEKQS